jgi:SAM-dependent MidA family methyltransferase
VDPSDSAASTLQSFNPSTELIELIRDRIRESGPVSFAWFMEQALYHPQFGYYASGRCEIGRRGDYFTNVSVGRLFGDLLAAQFLEIWSKLGETRDFVIVEQGAHHGELAADVLSAVRDSAPDFFSALCYWIVEPFVPLRDRQRQTLAHFDDKVVWRESVDALEPFVGVHFSNELLDSFPVHLICSCGPVARPLSTKSDQPWLEKCVGLENDQFVWLEEPIADPRLQAAVQRLPARPAGYTTEVNLSALDWIDHIAAKLTRGYLLAVDYGYPRDEFYAADRTSGTLQIRSKHRALTSPFESIGAADISAHVEWTSLAERAEQQGLRISGFTDQHHFLTGILFAKPELLEHRHPKTARALRTLLHPEMLGRTFQVLALAKDVAPPTTLSGFKFAHDARVKLGL